MPRLIINALMFQLLWFTCVVLRMPLAAVVTLVVVLLHLLWIRKGKGEWRVVVLVSIIGVMVDSALTAIGIFQFDDSWTAAASSINTLICPPWLMCLWFGFATTLNVSLRPLVRRPWLALLVGAIAGPFSYWVGAALGAVNLGPTNTIALSVLAVVWAFLLPILANLAWRLGGEREV